VRVLTRRDQRATVDRDRTVAVDPQACGPLLAQAGCGFPGPGPGCGLVRGSAPRARALAALGRAALGCFGPCWARYTVNLVKHFSEIFLWTFHVCFLLYFILHQRDKLNREIVSKKVSENKHSLFFPLQI
jgi:hypothetical protein